MVDLKYVKKKRTKKIVSIVTATTGCLLIPLILTSFIGRNIGHFTIGLKNNDVSLALSLDKDFTKTTTFMSLEKLPPYSIYTTSAIDNNNLPSEIDNVTSNERMGKKFNKDNQAVSLYFFKYTFYLKNVGNTDAYYNLTLKIVDNKRPSNVNYSLDDILRIRFYSNESEDTHSYITYAKDGITPHFEEGNPDPFYNSCISVTSDGVCSEYGYATSFESSSLVLKEDRYHFKINEIRRYTLLMYLEGSDEECVGTTPNETYLKLAMNIEAFEDINEK